MNKARAEENRFYHRAIGYLREEFPNETQSQNDDELKARINRLCLKALSFGLEFETEAMGFIDLDFRLEGALGNSAMPRWAREILEQRQVAPAERIFLLRDGYCTLKALEMEHDGK